LPKGVGLWDCRSPSGFHPYGLDLVSPEDALAWLLDLGGGR
jgi:hypothetical protein